VDELYRFLNSWVPHLYGELDEEAIKARGFELILNDTQWDDETGDPSKVYSNEPMSYLMKVCHEIYNLVSSALHILYEILNLSFSP
jgi:hypothetical protein